MTAKKTLVGYLSKRLLLAVLLFLTLAAWSMSSAVGGTPDENYVLTSIWCGDVPGVGDYNLMLSRIESGLASRQESGANGRLESGSTSIDVYGQTKYCKLKVNEPTVVLVPWLVGESGQCMQVSAGDTSAACQSESIDQTGRTDSFNKTLYPKTYLNVMRNFVGSDVQKSVVQMRLFNSLIAALLIVGTVSLNRRKGLDTFIAWLSITTPVVTYFIGSVNTSSWLLIGTSCFVFSVIGVIENRDDQRITSAFVALSALSFWLTTSARSEGAYVLIALAILVSFSHFLIRFKTNVREIGKHALWFAPYALVCVIIIFGVFVKTNRFHFIIGTKFFRTLDAYSIPWWTVTLMMYVMLSLPLVLIASAIYYLILQKLHKKTNLKSILLTPVIASLIVFFSRELDRFENISANILYQNFFSNKVADKTSLIISNLINLPRFVTGFFGSWGLGWFEIRTPQIVWLFTLQAFLLLLIFSIQKSNPTTRLAVGASIFVLCAIILAVLQKSLSEIGDDIQPRYFLPFAIAILITAAANKQERFPNSLVIAVAVLASIANSIGLRTVLRRYITGQDVSIGKSLNNPREWWWNFGPAPELVWLIGSLAFALLFAVVIYERRSEVATEVNATVLVSIA